MAYLKAFIHERPLCSQCNKNLARMSGKPLADGRRYFMPTCQPCTVLNKHGNKNVHDRPWHKPGKLYLIHRKDYCEKCGFKAVHICQLDVDHTDGDHNNNEVSNLQTLCANCHRLKTRETKQDHSKQWRQA